MANTLKFKRGLVAGIPTAALGEPLFTTDTFDLYIGNGTGNTRFQKYIASGATTQILRGDGSLYTFPLAISSPSNGQVLKYNGTSWVNDSDSGITGSGTTNYLPKFTGATILGNSLLQETTNAIGLGLTPSVWNTSALGFEVSQSNRAGFVVEHFSSSSASAGNSVNIGTGFYRGTADGSFRYQNSFTKPQMMYFFDGTTVWQQAAAGTSGNAITFSERMRIHATGNFGIGTGASDSGEKLQVTGTMKVTGASTFGGNMTLSLNQNSQTKIIVSNTTSGNGSLAFFSAASSGGSLDIGKYSATTNSYKIISANDGFINNETVGDLAIINNVATGNIKFAAGGSSTTQMILNASGNLGLGVTPSAWGGVFRALQITLGASISGQSNAVSAVHIAGNTYWDSSNVARYIGNEAAQRYRGYSGAHEWYTAPSGTAGNAITFTQAMTLTANGNLLINTTTDSGYKLRVNGTSYFDDNARFPNLKGVVFVQTGGTLLGSISMDSSNQVTIDNNGFFGLSVGSNYNLLGGNTGIGTSSFGTSATRTFAMLNGTAPSSSPVDSFQLYSNDVVAGNAAPHIRTENGAVIKLYQETTAVGNAIISLGGGNAVLDDTTFDGYTLRQLVRA